MYIPYSQNIINILINFEAMQRYKYNEIGKIIEDNLTSVWKYIY